MRLTSHGTFQSTKKQPQSNFQVSIDKCAFLLQIAHESFGQATFQTQSMQIRTAHTNESCQTHE